MTKPDLQHIEYWKETHVSASGQETTGLCIAWKNLKSGAAADSDLKVRKVFKARLKQKQEHIKQNYQMNMPMSVRNNGDGTYTVFDGNHRYHAIGHWIKAGKSLPNNPYTADFLVPCNVYRKEAPSDVCMRHGTMTNDVQLCASSGSPLDFLRFLTNITQQMKQIEGC